MAAGISTLGSAIRAPASLRASAVSVSARNVRGACHSGVVNWDLVVGFVGGLASAWFGGPLVHRWDVRRRTVAVVGRVEVIHRRDLGPLGEQIKAVRERLESRLP